MKVEGEGGRKRFWSRCVRSLGFYAALLILATSAHRNCKILSVSSTATGAFDVEDYFV